MALLSQGSGPLLGGSTPTARQRALATRRRRWRYSLACGLLLLVLWIASLFMIDVDSPSPVDKQAARHHHLETAGTPKHDSKPAVPHQHFSMVKRRDVAQSVPQKLRVYIYGDVVPAGLNRNLRGKEACWHGYTGTELLIPELIATTTVFTSHGELADFYLVPIVSECYILSEMRRGIDHRKAHDTFNALFSSTMDAVQSRYPFWAATEGRDHIFIFPSERGASTLSRENLQRIRKSILLTGLQQRDGGEWQFFNPWKDIVLPPAMTIQNPPPHQILAPSERTHLVYFRGTVPGIEDQGGWGLRAKLATDMKSEPGVLFRGPSRDCGRNCSLTEMAQSTFCLVPDGDVEGWSLRLFDSILQGCIPVILADTWELPFQEQIQWSLFTVKALERNADELVELLRAIPQSVVDDKAAELRGIADKFRWHSGWEDGDAFDSLLTMLDRRVRFMRNSPYRYFKEPSQYG